MPINLAILFVYKSVVYKRHKKSSKPNCKETRRGQCPPTQTTAPASAFFSGLMKSSREAPSHITSGLATNTEE